ncbi:hypothetical protein TC41_0025 [Alicyclobacillus acidocaldarius subsp. acidocaldarius Tc-4-1]|uniref:Uncharacterized protein n=1 Tax=Alicyclobacillus acidocaldarius (strain Tc-4-1) TaxID=1048834 RepID=F8IHN8_ALIAT|nr:hypothetical protein TC41_0025 [Alicyclobacillus acidocaldarius subsp. acidocaldarius Tc-4-1]
MYIREIAVKGLARTHISLFPSTLSRIQAHYFAPVFWACVHFRQEF